jgi:hypothetical protein
VYGSLSLVARLVGADPASSVALSLEMLRTGFTFVDATGVPCSGPVGSIVCLVDFYVTVPSVGLVSYFSVGLLKK